MEKLPMDEIVEWLARVHASYPIVGLLMLMMAIDVAVGLCAAIVTKSVSSTISQNGMTRKVIMLLLVGLGASLDPFAGDIPLAKMVAMAFVVTEAISITENAARAGVPLPQPLVEILGKLKNSEKSSVLKKPSDNTPPSTPPAPPGTQ